MLIQFTLKNFKCFKEEVKFSLIASNYDKTTKAEDNIFITNKFGLKLLKSAVIYGANASGKTKLIEGLAFMASFIKNSSKESQIEELIPVKPFLLSLETIEEPSEFEIIFIHEEILYRYGFEVDKDEIQAEWLYRKRATKEVQLFYRDYQVFEIHKTAFKVHDLVKNNRIRPNALLLSVAASWNNDLAKKIFDWLKKFNIISGLHGHEYENFSIGRMKKNKAEVIQFLKGADLGIEDLSPQKLSSEEFSALPITIKTQHKQYDKNNLVHQSISFEMEEDESAGTKQYFALSGPILDSIEKGSILIVDELANQLHPNLACKLVEIFNSADKNPHNAQLIFNTHDTNLLSSGLFRRDQIWFTEKNRYGAASLYSLSDIKDIRKEEDFEKNYIQGKYGAIPYLGDFEKLFHS